MPIPNAEAAQIAPEKLTDYLLNEDHPVGKSKANWFRSLGYDEANAALVLNRDLLELVLKSDGFSAKPSPFGTKYVVEGTITSPSGKTVNVTTVWIVETDDSVPRLVTAFPGR